ncbi:unnamed protein product [Psylliodes chrysocephalus]|uniref:Uncharacterized protein n=1 Tax=Psylliodes chrysocephalus TaxID=3402493 RepID=A0A9P0D430_9CUCU|nr:unnamed protein product [Psylliodes chrysocephala]
MYFLFLLIFADVATSNIISNDALHFLVTNFRTMSNQCVEEIDLNFRALQMFLRVGDTSDPELKKYLFCMGQTLGIQNAVGEMRIQPLEEFIEYILKNKYRALVLAASCITNEFDGPENIFETMECLLSEQEF